MKPHASDVARNDDRVALDKIDAAVDRALGEGRIVGCVVIVSQNGQRIHERSAGYADREQKKSAEIDTPFRYASLTKPFTTMAALKLAEAGKLDPQARLSRYLPDFRLQMLDGTLADPTLDQLMAHMAGLDYRFQQPADGSYARAGISDGLDGSVSTLAENLDLIAKVPLDVRPGTAWRYSVATDVLGAVIERVTENPLDRVIRELVCEPLGLETRFHWRNDDLAAAYRDHANRPKRMEGQEHVALPLFEGPGVSFDTGRIADASSWLSGGAGAAGRAGDMLKLLEAYREGSFLSEFWRGEARTARIGTEAQTQGPGWGYSWLGSVLMDPAIAGSKWSAGSVAWGGVYGASWGIDFDRGISFVSLTNTSVEGMFGQFAQDIAAAIGELRGLI